MGSGRWRIELVEEVDQLPVRWRQRNRRGAVPQDPADLATAALVTAFGLLARRGPGPTAWAASFRHDPIAFLLDSSSDAITLRGMDGQVVYRNRAAEEAGVGPAQTAGRLRSEGNGRLERRSCRFRCGQAEYLLEIVGSGTG